MFERIAIIVASGLIIYFKALRLGFVSDDIPSIAPKINPFHKRLLNQFSNTPKYDRDNIAFPRLITILLHIAVCVFIYLGLGRDTASFIAGLLFLINPVNNQGSIWLSGRVGYVLPTLLLLMAMTFWWVSPVFIYLAMLKATAFVSPVAFIGSDKWWFFLIAIPIWIFGAKKFKSQVLVKQKGESVAKDLTFHPRKLILGVKTFCYYFYLCVIPHKITFYHSFMQSGAGAGNDLMSKRAYAKDKWFWGGIAILSSWWVYCLFRWDGLSWGVWWFMVCIAPFTNIIRVQQEIAERYVYMANVGLMYSVAYFLCKIL